jgi:uncharacterized membrane protein YphA (DoxX/SURF4 family)
MIRADPVIIMIAAYALAIIFAASAWAKIADIGSFEAAVKDYGLLPAALVKVFARALPIFEVAGAIGLLMARTRLAAAAVLLLLLASFTIAIAANLVRGRKDIDCGCFGPALRQKLSGWLLFRNATLCGAGLTALLPAGERNPTGLDWSTVAFAVVAFVLIYAAANFLIATWPRTLEYQMFDA